MHTDGDDSTPRNDLVNWSLSRSDGGPTGTVDANGFYTAPSSVPSQTVDITLTATPKAGSAAPSTAVIRFSYYPPPWSGLALTPSSGNGTQQGFRVSVVGMPRVPNYIDLMFNETSASAVGGCLIRFFPYYAQAGLTFTDSWGTTTTGYVPLGYTAVAYEADNTICLLYGPNSTVNMSASAPYVQAAVLFGPPNRLLKSYLRSYDYDYMAGPWIESGSWSPTPSDGPQLNLSSPATGSVVSGTVAISGTVADSQASIQAVQVFVDGTLLVNNALAANGTSFSANWDTSAYAAGPHKITVIAWDRDAPTNQATYTARTVQK